MNAPVASTAYQHLLSAANTQPHIRVGGTIRSGIKVLTRVAAKNPVAARLYTQGVADGLSFDDVEKQIKAAVPGLSYPLVPRNVEYFSVREVDFPNPSTAREILEKFGEDRGEGLRLYRFPLIFGSDFWQQVIEYEMACYAGSKKLYWSRVGADGAPECVGYAPTLPLRKGEKPHRHFGKKEHVLRADNQGVCDPNSCNEYQNKQCNMTGRILFYIPGIKSALPIQFKTRSWNTVNEAIGTVSRIASLRGGRLAGYIDDENTCFYLTKRLRATTFVNEEGQTATGMQWIAELEAPLDVAKLLANMRDQSRTIVVGAAAADLLQPKEAPSPAGAAAPSSGASPTVVAGEATRVGDALVPADAAVEEAPPAATATSADSGPIAATTESASSGGNQGLEDVVRALKDGSIEPDLYLVYADLKHGEGWRRNPGAVRGALAEIATGIADPAAFTNYLIEQMAS